MHKNKGDNFQYKFKICLLLDFSKLLKDSVYDWYSKKQIPLILIFVSLTILRQVTKFNPAYTLILQGGGGMAVIIFVLGFSPHFQSWFAEWCKDFSWKLQSAFILDYHKSCRNSKLNVDNVIWVQTFCIGRSFLRSTLVIAVEADLAIWKLSNLIIK